jgi:hypothetical protein
MELFVMVYKSQVKLWNTSNRRRNLGKFAAVWLMLALWLGTLALTVSPELHQLLHQDSQNLNHECFVTQLSKASSVLSNVAVPTLAPPWIELNLSFLSEPGYFSLSDYRLSPSRAPPSVISPTTVVG